MPITVIDNLTLTASSEEELLFTLRRNDGSGLEPVDLNGATVVLKRKEMKSGVEDKFSTSDPSPKLTIQDADNGVVKFSPASTDWVSGNRYLMYLTATTAGGSVLNFTEGGRISVEVLEEYGET